MTQKTALISLTDKTNIIPLAKALEKKGVQILSTGGTAKILKEAGLKVQEVAERTKFPEMLDGRVKTLHPVIHGGLLARRDLPEHMKALQEHQIQTIDYLIVNLYPFEKTIAQPNCTLADAIENIDIGGPAMVRSAAKNWQHTAVITDPAQYPKIISELEKGELEQNTHFELAVAAFALIAQYDAAISNYLSAIKQKNQAPETNKAPEKNPYPAQLTTTYQKIQDLRYGENPHQSAAFYKEQNPAPASLATATQLQGKELSYNNIADADAAWECVKQWKTPACVIVKHANPCGVALAENALSAYQKAFKTDPTSAFGGIIALNTEIDEAAATQIITQFVEVLIAPAYTQKALEIIATKPNIRALQIPLDGTNSGANQIDTKKIGGGLLVQSIDSHTLTEKDLKIVTNKTPSPEQIQDMLFAWKVAQYVKSNAIVFCANQMTMGVGAGQMSRLDSARIASIKAGHAGLSLQNTVVASDAFFPFRDGLDVVIDHGANCVIQPGGSMRDQEVIDAANERGIIMAFTGVRHFRH